MLDPDLHHNADTKPFLIAASVYLFIVTKSKNRVPLISFSSYLVNPLRQYPAGHPAPPAPCPPSYGSSCCSSWGGGCGRSPCRPPPAWRAAWGTGCRPACASCGTPPAAASHPAPPNRQLQLHWCAQRPDPEKNFFQYSGFVYNSYGPGKP